MSRKKNNINKNKFKNKKKFTILTLGCSKNVVDSENLITELSGNGWEFVCNVNEASTVLINTCGFIQPAIDENLEIINSAISLKKNGKIEKLIVFGCLVERWKNSLPDLFKEVDFFCGANEAHKIVKELTSNTTEKKPYPIFKLTPKHYAYIKIAEGCDRQCSFCTIPQIRGRYKSRRMKDILLESQLLIQNGTKEIILLAQDTTYYGMDLYKKQMLPKLLKNISKNKKKYWIRLLYTYPQHFPLDILKIMKDSPNFCKYLDLPLQHISDKILKSMRRGINTKETYSLIEKIRKEIPEITLRTTFIVGYPLETEKDFKQLKDFIAEMEFDKIGFFQYYAEDIAPSYSLQDKIPSLEKQRRIDELIDIQLKIIEKKQKEKLGKLYQVLIDEKEPNSNYYIARSEEDAPEIDYCIKINSAEKLKIGEFYTAQIVDYQGYDLIAKIVK